MEKRKGLRGKDGSGPLPTAVSADNLPAVTGKPFPIEL